MVMTPAEIFCEMQTSDNTKRAYRNDINKWQQFLASRGGEETTETALAFKAALENTYSPSTAQRTWGTVAAFYGWMKGTGRVDATPFHGIKSPTRPINEAPPVPSDEAIAKLLNACKDGTPYGKRAWVIISLLLNGLRAQEVCDVKIKDIVRDTNNKQWILNVLGKGDKWRAVPLTSEAQQAIYEFFENSITWNDRYLVTSVMAGEKLNVKSVWTAVRVYALKAGLKDENIHPHALRHHYATRLVRSGVNIFTLQKLMGHARADTTQRYVQMDYSDLSIAVELDPLHKSDESHGILFVDKALEHADDVPF
jgi:site-specific recombinase XerD